MSRASRLHDGRGDGCLENGEHPGASFGTRQAWSRWLVAYYAGGVIREASTSAESTHTRQMEWV